MQYSFGVSLPLDWLYLPKCAYWQMQEAVTHVIMVEIESIGFHPGVLIIVFFLLIIHQHQQRAFKHTIGQGDFSQK